MPRHGPRTVLYAYGRVRSERGVGHAVVRLSSATSEVPITVEASLCHHDAAGAAGGVMERDDLSAKAPNLHMCTRSCQTSAKIGRARRVAPPPIVHTW